MLKFLIIYYVVGVENRLGQDHVASELHLKVNSRPKVNGRKYIWAGSGKANR